MLFILTVQSLQCKYIQGLIQISQDKIHNSILYCFCVCKKYNVALYYISHFIMHQNISGDRSFIVLNEGYILKYHARDLGPEVGGKSSLLKTLCTQTKGSEAPELYVTWKHPPWGLAVMVAEGDIQAFKGEKWPTVLSSYDAYEQLWKLILKANRNYLLLSTSEYAILNLITALKIESINGTGEEGSAFFSLMPSRSFFFHGLLFIEFNLIRL